MPIFNTVDDEAIRKRRENFNSKLLALVERHGKATVDKKSLNDEIRKMINERGADITISITHTALIDLDLSDFDLSGADFSYTSMENVNFTNSRLGAASFRGKDRINRNKIDANFTDADCQGADFYNTDLRTSIFKKTTLDDRILIKDAVFKDAWLSKDILDYLIPYAQCDEVLKAQVSLDGTSLEGENLYGMNLSKLYLTHMSFNYADLKQVIFGNSDINGSYFSKAKNLNVKQLLGCSNIKAAHLPSKLVEKHKDHVFTLAGTAKIDTFFKPAATVTPSKIGKSVKRKSSASSQILSKQAKVENDDSVKENVRIGTSTLRPH